MELDHPTLEPFEPLITRLMHHCFGGGLAHVFSRGLRTAGDQWHTEAHRGFRAACFADFKTTQMEVGAAIIELQNGIMHARVEEAKARRARDESLRSIVDLRRVLENRQLVLRRLMDSIVWVLVWPERWILRRVRIEGGMRPVESRLVAEVLKAANDSTEKRRDVFALVSDLTTVMQLGDLLVARLRRPSDAISIRFVELKVGPVNRLIYDLLHSRDAESRKELAKRLVETAGAGAGKQTVRMARQVQRLAEFNRIISTDEGRHPTLGRPIRMTGERTATKDYRDELAELIGRAKAQGSAGLRLDDCLGLLAVAGEGCTRVSNASLGHAMYHLLSPEAYCKLNRPDEDEEIRAANDSPRAVDLFDFAMRSSLAMPPPIWYPLDAFTDVLFGRVKIFARFDLDRFFRISERKGLRMALVRGKSAEPIKQQKASGPIIGYPGAWGVRVEREDGRTVVLGSRFFARVYWDLVPPCALLAMARSFVDEICRRESKERVGLATGA